MNCWSDILHLKERKYNGTIHQLFMNSEVCDSAGREVLYSILIECDIHMKVIGLLKIFLNGTFIEVHTSRNLMHFLFRMS